RRPPFRNVPDNVNRSLLRASLLRVRRSRDYRKAAKARVRSFAKLLAPGHSAVWATRPFPESVRQNRFAGIFQDVRRSPSNVLQQHLVDLDYAESGVMRQNNVVDRIERVHPLSLRAQYLLQQPEVLYRDRHLPRTAL